jgi:hypothetical protein
MCCGKSVSFYLLTAFPTAMLQSPSKQAAVVVLFKTHISNDRRVLLKPISALPAPLMARNPSKRFYT